MNKYLPLTLSSLIYLLAFTISPVHAQQPESADILFRPESVQEQQSAQSGVTVVVSPPRFDIDAKPGETVQKTIKVSNNSDQELILNAQTIDFIVEDDLGTPVKVDTQASGRFLASPWFTLQPSEIVIPPHAQELISALIVIPVDALPGGHYAGVFFQPVSAKGQKTTVSYTQAQVGSLFGITIAGDIKYDALIKDFQTKQRFYEFGPVDFTASIENQSDTHIRPQTSISITNWLGQKVASIPVDQMNIFPFTSRSLSATWDQVWGIGQYTATLTAVYGPEMVTERSIHFWLIPFRLMAALIVVLLVLVVTMISVKRHLRHRQDTRDQEIDELKRKIVELENKS